MWYSYECPQCARELELQASVDQRDQQVCPQCGSPLKRLFRPQTIRFQIPLRHRAGTENEAGVFVFGERGEYRQVIEENIRLGKIRPAGNRHPEGEPSPLRPSPLRRRR